MKNRNSKLLAACLAAAVFTAGVTQSTAAELDPIGPKLTPRLKQMLVEEMLSVKQSVKMILDGLIVGDHFMVGAQAQQIHDSFILARSLTDQDKKDLMKAASPDFLQKDGEFHQTAQKLANAAAHKDYELQRFYYARLIDSCQGCHSQHATDRFPAFSGAQPEGHSH